LQGIGDEGDGDWFSDSDFVKKSVISLHPNILRYNSSSKNIYQYTAYLIASELMQNICKQELLHKRHSYCLFDYCSDQSDFKDNIDHGQICSDCYGKLKNIGINEGMLKDIKKVLGWCKGAAIKYALKKTFRNPLTNQLAGAFLPLLLMIKIPKYILILPVFMIVIIIFLYYKIMASKKP
jgi:hypothetical protein